MKTISGRASIELEYIFVTQDAYREYKDILNQCRENDNLTIEEALAVISIDLQSAFDTVEWDEFFEMLRKMNIPDKLISTIRRLYSTRL